MDWKGGRRSDNVDDQRNSPGVPIGISGAPPLLRLLPFLLQTKFGRTLLIIGVIVYFGAKILGIDLLQVADQSVGQSPASASRQSAQLSAADKELADFVSVVLASTEDIWTPLFQKNNKRYQAPRLILFRNSVSSACGFAQAAMGPFYCPSDNKLYIDLSFYEAMKNQLGAPGDFAQAYVIAHEVGHHVQNLLGISTKVHQAQQRASQVEANRLSVKLELQADCLAGIWGHYANTEQKLLEEGDIEEALNAATAIGDDRLQKQSQGRIQPESFTHGSSAQRMQWFKRGFDSGRVAACDTFAIK